MSENCSKTGLTNESKLHGLSYVTDHEHLYDIKDWFLSGSWARYTAQLQTSWDWVTDLINTEPISRCLSLSSISRLRFSLNWPWLLAQVWVSGIFWMTIHMWQPTKQSVCPHSIWLGVKLVSNVLYVMKILSSITNNHLEIRCNSISEPDSVPRSITRRDTCPSPAASPDLVIECAVIFWGP